MPNGQPGPRVLVVEDDAANRALLTSLLTRSGYRPTAVADGRSGLRAAIDDAPDLVLLDVEMLEMNGFDVCRALRSDPRTVALPVILVTGRTDVSDVVTGLDAGADDFLRKPFDQAELMARVRSVLRLAAALTEVAGAHPLIGERICAPLAASEAFGPIVRHHHEHWDGRGYPDGLRGEAIPLGARIVGLVDAFDAMVHARPYRAARPVEQALAELRRERGRQFDPALVAAFLPIIEGRPRRVDARLGVRALRTMRGLVTA